MILPVMANEVLVKRQTPLAWNLIFHISIITILIGIYLPLMYCIVRYCFCRGYEEVENGMHPSDEMLFRDLMNEDTERHPNVTTFIIEEDIPEISFPSLTEFQETHF